MAGIAVDSVQILDVLTGLHRLWKEDRYTDIVLSDGKHLFRAHRILVEAFTPDLLQGCHNSSQIVSSTLPGNMDKVLSWLYSLPDVTSEFLKVHLKPVAKALNIKFVENYKASSVKTDVVANVKFKQLWLDEFSSKLRQYYNNSSFSDINLKVEGQLFRCHKAVLASVSPFFDTMFSSGMRETKADEIDLYGIKKSVFRKILDAIYLGENIINASNIETLTSTCSYLQLSKLQDQCVNFLIRNMDPVNVIGVLRLAELNNIDHLRNKAQTYIIYNIRDVVKSNDFSTLSKEQVIEYVQDDDLNVSDETYVFETVVKWFESCSRPLDELELILKEVSLLDVKRSAIVNVLHNKKYFQSDSACKNILLDVIRNVEYVVSPSRRLRNVEVLLVVRTSAYENGVHVACYNFQNKQWYELASLSKYTAGSAFAACALGPHVYLTGGSGNPRVFLTYNILNNEWRSLPKLLETRSEHVAVAAPDAVYVLGGSNQVHSVNGTIDKYSITKEEWRRCGTLALPVADASAAVVGNKILVLGGSLSFGEYTDAIQCFDTTTETCSVIGKLPMQCSFTDIAVHEHIFYIISPRGHVMEYEYGKDPVLLGNAHKSSFMDFSTVYYRGLIFIIGGTSNKSESAEMKVFDLQSQNQAVRKHVKLPWKRLSNQYFSLITRVNQKFLSQEIKEL